MPLNKIKDCWSLVKPLVHNKQRVHKSKRDNITGTQILAQHGNNKLRGLRYSFEVK
jgi:hypothetical protein